MRSYMKYNTVIYGFYRAKKGIDFGKSLFVLEGINVLPKQAHDVALISMRQMKKKDFSSDQIVSNCPIAACVHASPRVEHSYTPRERVGYNNIRRTFST